MLTEPDSEVPEEKELPEVLPALEVPALTILSEGVRSIPESVEPRLSRHSKPGREVFSDDMLDIK